MHPHLTPRDIARLNSGIDTNGDCWLWTRSTTSHGYGQITVAGRNLHAHRLSYLLTYGDFPEHLGVLHRCDNPRCCRPDHLFLGAHADNMADMAAKGRTAARRHPDRLARGEQHGHAVLTPDKVRVMRALHASGAMGIRPLARQFGCSRTTVKNAILGTTWAHVETDTADPDVARMCAEVYNQYLTNPDVQPKKPRGPVGLRHTQESRAAARERRREQHLAGRDIRGERVSTAKLTAQTVRVIRQRYAAGDTITDLARDFGVYWSTIQKIVQGRAWKHVI